jgi:hypothetical protein
MSNANRKKSKQLKMSYGAACNKLRKELMFNMARSLNKLICFRCKKEIKTIDEFSIDHKIAWLDSNDPINLFFDLNNVVFSHFICNIKAQRKISQKYPNKNGKAWCSNCRKYVKTKNFGENPRKQQKRTLRYYCNKCRKIKERSKNA